MLEETNTTLHGSGSTDEQTGEIVATPFEIEVTYKEEVTEEERDAAAPQIKALLDSLDEDPEAIPACITSLTIRRI